jgi:hypothetical protein
MPEVVEDINSDDDSEFEVISSKNILDFLIAFIEIIKKL